MKIVLVGAGGSGMSNIAHILRDLGYTNLLAIDGAISQITEALAQKGIPLQIGHGKYLPHPEDIVIYSEAAKKAPEVEHAFQVKKEHHLPMKIRNYFEFLGELSKYFRTIGIAGTNGKSSSTAMALIAAKKLLPDFGLGIVGALVPDLDNQSYYLEQEKKSEFRQMFDAIFTGKKIPFPLIKKYRFFIEACEYKRHFLHLDLEYLLITNIELDHTDYYTDIKDYCSAFLALATKSRHTLILQEEAGEDCFPTAKRCPVLHWQLHAVRGKHTDCNLSLLFGLFQELLPGLSPSRFQEVLFDFKGIWRRMEYLGTWTTGAKVFSDYGHIASSLQVGHAMLKERFSDKKIVTVFQPHQLHRVLQGWEDFKKALALFDASAIFAVYAAREQLSDFVHEKLFQQRHFKSISEFGAYFAEDMNADYLDSFSEFQKWMDKTDEQTIVVVFTAGDLDFQIRKHFPPQ